MTRTKKAPEAETPEAEAHPNDVDISATSGWCELTVFDSGYENKGRYVSADADTLASLLTRPATTKENQRLIKLGKFKNDSRAKEDKAKAVPPPTIEYFTGVELESDGGAPMEDNLEVLRSLNLRALVYETWTDEPNRYRILLPFSRRMDLLRREGIRRAITKNLSGITKECKDVRRGWFIGRPKGQARRYELLDGVCVDELPWQDQGLIDAAKTDDDKYNALKEYVQRQYNGGVRTKDALVAKLEEKAELLFPGYLETAKAKRLYNYVDWCVAKNDEAEPENDEADDLLIYDASEYQFEAPTPQPYIGDGWLPENVPSMLVGPGGGGKGWFSLQLAVCSALGLDFMGRKTKQVRTLFVSTEDDRDQLHRRLHGMLQKLAVPKSELNFLIADWTGIDPVLWDENSTAPNKTTPLYGQLRQACDDRNVELLILDNSAQLFGGNENDRRSVTAFSRATSLLAPTTLVLGHVNKLSVESGGHASGSTAQENARRSVFGIFGKQGEQRQFKVIKTNYTEPELSAPITWDSDHKFLDFGVLSAPSLATDGGNVVLKRMAELQLANTRIFRAASGGATNIKTSLKLEGYNATQLDKQAQKLKQNGFIVETLEQRAQTWRVTEAGFAFLETLPKF